MARVRFGRRLEEDVRRGLATGLTPPPARSGSGSLVLVPVIAFEQRCYTARWAWSPCAWSRRPGRASVGLDDRGVVVCVRAAPEGGRATEEARRALAESLGVPGSAVELHRGTRSRTKVFDVAGLGQEQAEMRPRATVTDSLPP